MPTRVRRATIPRRERVPFGQSYLKGMGKEPVYRFDPIDLDQIRILTRLPAQKRVRVMLDARELAVGLMRGRLRRQYPALSARAINLKLLEELAREERAFPRD